MHEVLFTIVVNAEQFGQGMNGSAMFQISNHGDLCFNSQERKVCLPVRRHRSINLRSNH